MIGSQFNQWQAKISGAIEHDPIAAGEAFWQAGL
jgi:hypothetical protein